MIMALNCKTELEAPYRHQMPNFKLDYKIKKGYSSESTYVYTVAILLIPKYHIKGINNLLISKVDHLSEKC